ncbi:MAG: porin [Candidatus Bathyanammoxibius sp.]
MKRLLLIVPLFVLAFSGTTLAVQDPDIQYLIERMQALEETVNTQAGQIKSQRAEIEGLKAVQRRSGGTPTYRGVAYRLPEPEGSGHDISGEDLENAIKDYLGTEQGKELMAESSPSKLRAGYHVGKGFYLESLDDKFRLQINDKTQIRYTFATDDDSRDTSSFRVRRNELKFTGHAFTKDLTYVIEWGLASGNGVGKLLDTYVNYRVTDWLQFRGGQYKVPYNRQEMTSSGKQTFVDRSLANEEFNLSRDIGVMVHAKPFNGLFEYYFAMMQGAGLNQTKNSNNQMLYAARLVVSPLGKFNNYSESDIEYHETPKFALGGAFTSNNGSKIFFNDKITTFNRDVNVKQATVDLIFKWRGFAFMGDGYWRRLDAHTGETGFARNGINANGYTLQAGYFVPLPYVRKHLEFAGRYSFVNPNTDVSKNSEQEVGGGTNWYFNGHRNKFQADIRRITTKQPSKEDIKDTEFRLQYQLIF